MFLDNTASSCYGAYEHDDMQFYSTFTNVPLVYAQHFWPTADIAATKMPKIKNSKENKNKATINSFFQRVIKSKDYYRLPVQTNNPKQREFYKSRLEIALQKCNKENNAPIVSYWHLFSNWHAFLTDFPNICRRMWSLIHLLFRAPRCRRIHCVKQKRILRLVSFGTENPIRNLNKIFSLKFYFRWMS